MKLVIPLAAEDHLLKWLDSKFAELAKYDAWSKWLDLLRLIHGPSSDNNVESCNTNGNVEDDNLVDVDIFDDTEPNTFDETIYTSYKCYNYLTKQVEIATLDSANKQEILSEFKDLQNI